MFEPNCCGAEVDVGLSFELRKELPRENRLIVFVNAGDMLKKKGRMSVRGQVGLM